MAVINRSIKFYIKGPLVRRLLTHFMCGFSLKGCSLFLPRFVKPMEDKKCLEDETAVIECMVSGSPKPRLTW